MKNPIPHASRHLVPTELHRDATNHHNSLHPETFIDTRLFFERLPWRRWCEGMSPLRFATVRGLGNSEHCSGRNVVVSDILCTNGTKPNILLLMLYYVYGHR